jgi:signal peptidase II
MADEVRETERDALPVHDEPRATLSEKVMLFVVTAAIVVVDQLSKRLIEVALPLNQSCAPIDSLAHLFRITHVSNTGAAFGLFPSGSLLFTIVAIAVAAVIVVYNFRLPANNRMFRFALGLQLGGAMGNLIDRFRLGHVTDFLDFGPWPVFNVADTSIVAGVIVLALLLLVEQRQEAERRRASARAQQREMAERAEEGNMLWNE